MAGSHHLEIYTRVIRSSLALFRAIWYEIALAMSLCDGGGSEYDAEVYHPARVSTSLGPSDRSSH